ncbi:uncharacterized protein RJT21DRAFT_84882 [Scheffersomyces amazonensis]|uniref:uncharacterized protein n=1 Tax=Scheffersomyces amazonensis TaxID=1078765 RepID=UPI00315DAB2A
MTSAIFTLLYTPSYLPGALVLGSTLKRLLAQQQSPNGIETGILIDKSKFTSHQLNLLGQFYDTFVDVNPLQSTITDKLNNDLGRPELDKTFTKINLWSLIHYDKILYLDSDTLPLLPSDPDQGSVVDLLSLDFPKFKILAAPDSGFPDIFNSGVFVLKPNLNDYTILDSLVRESVTNPHVSFDGADQGLLNQYFNTQPDWVRSLLSQGKSDVSEATTTSGSNWVKIPFLYNVTPSAQYEYLPAYKHFTTFNPEFPPSNPVDIPISSEGGEQEDSDKPILESTFDTLNRYHSTALTFIQSGPSQVKLIHFIGPYKPWKSSSTATGIHRDWWKVWIETFGEKSVDEIINLDTTPYTFEAIQETHEDNIKVYVAPPETYEEPTSEEPETVFTPATLLDPSNYQRYEDTIVPSVDSLWDPAKEPPPVHDDGSSTYHAPYVMEQSMRSFTNQWDEQEHSEPPHYEEPAPPPPPQYHEEPAPLPTPPPQVEPVHVEVPKFAYSHYAEPERVFDSSSDYFPQHRLQPLEKIDIIKEEQESQSINGIGENVTEFIDFNERLTKLGIIEERDGFEDIYEENVENIDAEEEVTTHDTEDDRSDIPKLFPWEFRQSHQHVERVFE